MKSLTNCAISIITPTRNERETIPTLLNELQIALAGIPAEVLIIDDSDDDTPNVIKRVTKKMRGSLSVRCVHRKPGPDRAGGLSSAVCLGLAEAKADYVAIIDADLQHPPQMLRNLYEEAYEHNADVVMATRYKAGGSYEGLDGVSRKLISMGMKWTAKILFPETLKSVSDPLGGFFLIRRSIISGVELRPIGYKISLEILVRGKWSIIREVPYQFHARIGGQSKADFKQGFMALQHMWRLICEVPHAARIWKFLLVGFCGTVINLAAFTYLLHIGAAEWFALIIGAELGTLNNFTLHNLITWRDKRSTSLGGLAQNALKFHLSSSMSIIANFLLYALLRHFIAFPLLDNAVAIMLAMIVNYTLADTFVFVDRGAISKMFQSLRGKKVIPDEAQSATLAEAQPVGAQK